MIKIISVIIPAHNEERYIEMCLKSLRDQKRKPDEVIVVCDACNDHTYLNAKKYTSKVHNVYYHNVSKTKNYGRKISKGNIKVYIDADCTMKKNMLEKIELYCNKGYIGGTCMTKSIEPGFADVVWDAGNFLNNFFLLARGIVFSHKIHPKFRENMNVAEDTYFLHALQRKGRIKYISSTCIRTSSRRFREEGYAKPIIKQILAYLTQKKIRYSAVR